MSVFLDDGFSYLPYPRDTQNLWKDIEKQMDKLEKNNGINIIIAE